jgi:hypothetical protein
VRLPSLAVTADSGWRFTRDCKEGTIVLGVDGGLVWRRVQSVVRNARTDNRKLGTWMGRWVDVTVGWVGINLAAVPPLHGRRSRGANKRENRPFRSG